MKYLIVTIFFLLHSSLVTAELLLYSTAQGGNPSTSYQPATYAPSSENIRLRGHFMFKNGITIPSFWTFTWDAEGIVNGLITIPNTNSLTLASDLRLGTTASLSGDGWYLGIGGQNKKITLGGDMTLSKGILINSDLTIDGQGHTLTMAAGPDNGRLVANSSTFTLKNMTLVLDNSGDSTEYLFRPGNYILENIKIKCAAYPNASATLFGASAAGISTVTIRGHVSIESPGIPVLFSKAVSSINPHAVTVNIEKNSILAIGPKTVFALTSTAGTTCSINFADRTSILSLDGCDFYTSSVGGVSASALAALSLTKGTVMFKNKVRIFNAVYNTSTYAPYSPVNTDMSKALIFGDGISAGDIDIRVLGDAYVVVSGCIDYRHS